MFRLVAVGILLALVFSFKAKPLNLKNSKNNKKECVLEDLSTAGLGDVKHSILSESAFQSVNGEEWVLLAGQSKTELGITSEDSVFDQLNVTDNISIDNLPDARGVFLRGKNNSDQISLLNNPDGDLELGAFYGDAMRNIVGEVGSWNSRGARDMNTGAFALAGNAGYQGQNYGSANSGLFANFDASRVVPVANDNRPKNITVNTFVKVKRGCLDAVALAERRAAEARVQALEDYIVKNSCDSCLTLPESDLSSQQAKAACFKTEVDAFEAETKDWSVSCQARTIGNAKKILMTIGENRTTDETDFLSHLDNQYPYYNVIETAKR